MTVVRSFQIPSGDILLALFLRVDDVAIQRRIGDFAQIADVIDGFGRIGKG